MAGDLLHLDGSLTIPYRWPAGRAASRFLRTLAEGRVILGARLHSGEVVVPPPDRDEDLSPIEGYVPVGPGGVVETLVRVTRAMPGAPLDAPYGVALILLDGASRPFLHLIEGKHLDRISVGSRVRACFAEADGAEAPTMALLRSFVPEGTRTATSPLPPVATAPEVEPVRVTGGVDLKYRWAFGTRLSRFFTALRDEKRILGSRCPSCAKVSAPPQVCCPLCYLATDELCEVGPHATLVGAVENRLAYPGQPMKPPYWYAALRLDGADTIFHHVLAEVAAEEVTPGLRLEPLFAEKREGILSDIRYFRPVRGEV